MISDENVINQSKDSIDTKKKITQPLKRYISAMKSLLSPISSNSSTSLQDLKNFIYVYKLIKNSSANLLF